MGSREYELYRRTSEVYAKNGIKNTTMADMASKLKISKKTLYKFVNDRPELVSNSMTWKLAHDTKIVNDIIGKNLNAVAELYEISNFYCSNLMGIHPSIYLDLEKYYPNAWNQFTEYKNIFIYNIMFSNMKKGIIEGLYRDDFDVEVIVRLYTSKVDMVFDPRIFPVEKFKFSEVYLEMVNYHLAGIVSEEGMKEIHHLTEEVVPRHENELIAEFAY